ncbi:MAG: metallophosphoesterase family protein [Acidimicrobiia bacterium]
MLIGLISDPHANLEAVQSVLQDVDRVRPDAIVCLGDFVGYGGSPNEVVAALQDRCDLSLIGNHDLAAVGRVDLDIFRDVAAEAVVWTRDQLNSESSEFLQDLSPRASFSKGTDIELAHASFVDPVWEYITSSAIAAWSFSSVDFEVAAVGHTHVPAVFWQTEEGIKGFHVSVPNDDVAEVQIDFGRVILNPGGVGQPRDGDPRASWATWDSIRKVFAVRRVEYPIEQAQRTIRRAGLPAVLADRLAEGW